MLLTGCVWYQFQYYDACAGQHGTTNCSEAGLHALHSQLNLDLTTVAASDAQWVTVVQQDEYMESMVHDDFAAVNARYVRLVIDQSTCPDGQFPSQSGQYYARGKYTRTAHHSLIPWDVLTDQIACGS